MNRSNIIIALIGLAGLLSACSNPPVSGHGERYRIDIADALTHPAELKLSDLGKDVRYVRLETNDTTLVPRNPSILLFDKYIALYNYASCMLFHKETGKFISYIGHIGDDPTGYSLATPAYNDVNRLLYFTRYPNSMQKYTISEEYRGKAIVPLSPGMPEYFLFTDSLIIGHFGGVDQTYNSNSLIFFTEDGCLADSVPNLLPRLPRRSFSNIKEYRSFPLGMGNGTLSIFNDKSAVLSIKDVPALWKYRDNAYFKSSFNDTVYVVKGHKLIPDIVFSLGKWQWGPEARTDGQNSEERMLVTTVYETDHHILFQCCRGVYSEAPETFTGIYRKADGKVILNNEREGFTDDFSGYLPFRPETCSPQGEYARIAEASELSYWLEEHPEALKDARFAALRDLKEDDNPVIVLTVPH